MLRESLQTPRVLHRMRSAIPSEQPDPEACVLQTEDVDLAGVDHEGMLFLWHEIFLQSLVATTHCRHGFPGNSPVVGAYFVDDDHCCLRILAKHLDQQAGGAGDKGGFLCQAPRQTSTRPANMLGDRDRTTMNPVQMATTREAYRYPFRGGNSRFSCAVEEVMSLRQEIK